MESLDELLRQAEAAHGHLCAGQVLGVRMALLGLARLGIADPRGADRKRLVTYVEIDRCATDAIALVTGCRLGKRALKFRDWGKMAATFVELGSGRALRIVALEDTRELAEQLYPHLETKSRRQLQAYRELPDAQLFHEQWVRVNIDPADLPGRSGDRVVCQRCREGVNFGRLAVVNGESLCLTCARPELRYWKPAAPEE
ncbi:MAG: FmdE family protein [Terracidiphilus sp.]